MPLSDILPATTSSPEATIVLGASVAEFLRAGDVVALYGDLGAGKTHFVKGIARGLGGDPKDVTSPTFTLIQEYPTDPPLYHLDVYRVETMDELERIGAEEYLSGNGICVIEWPGRMEAMLPEGTLRLKLSHVDAGQRRFDIVRDDE